MTITRLVADYLVPGEGDGRVITAAALDIGPDGRIIRVGTHHELEVAHNATDPDEVVETLNLGGVLMPGLVNTHAHTPMTLVRSVGDGMPLQQWLTDAVWPLERNMGYEAVRAAMRLGSVEMLSSGVTTSCEMYLHEDAVADAVAETGARLVMTPAVIAGLGSDDNVEARINEIIDFRHRRHQPSQKISVGFAPHSLYNLSPSQVAEVAQAACGVGALLHLHLEETEAERHEIMGRWGATATQLLARYGVLEAKVLAAHGVWLDRNDMKLLAEAGASVAHCPQSNLKLGSGIARIGALIESGVNIGVGTDGPASNDDLDLWEEMKLAPLLARGVNHDPTLMSAADALNLATRSGAQAVGLDDVGELKAGFWADVIRVDLDVPVFTPVSHETLLTALVFAGSGRYVTDVWVGGDRVVNSSMVSTIDIDAAMSDAARASIDLRQ